MALRTPLSEMIGRVGRAIVRTFTRATVDTTTPDYKFYDELRRGKREGYKLGGLFAAPITETIVTHMMGPGILVSSDNADLQERLTDMLDDNLPLLIGVAEDSMGLGDAYVLVDVDGSLQQLSPDTVDIITYPEGSQSVVGYRVTAKFEKIEIITEYYDFFTVQTTKTAGDAKGTTEFFPNFRNMIPVIHFPNDRSANELHGHSMVDSLLTLFAEYDDVLLKSLMGVKVMGVPIPVLEDSENPKGELEANKTGNTTFTDTDGTTVTRPVIDFSEVSMLAFGKGARFNLKSPDPFTEDAGRMLEYLFLLMLEKTHIPEWVWGGGISSSKASVDAQAPAWLLFLQGRRIKLNAPLKLMLEVWRRTITIYESIDLVTTFKIRWPRIGNDDRQIMLSYLNAAYDREIIPKETYLRLMDLVENPDVEVTKAESESVTEPTEDQTVFNNVTNTV